MKPGRWACCERIATVLLACGRRWRRAPAAAVATDPSRAGARRQRTQPPADTDARWHETLCRTSSVPQWPGIDSSSTRCLRRARACGCCTCPTSTAADASGSTASRSPRAREQRDAHRALGASAPAPAPARDAARRPQRAASAPRRRSTRRRRRSLATRHRHPGRSAIGVRAAPVLRAYRAADDRDRRLAVGILSALHLVRRRQEVLYGLFGLAALLWALRTLTFVFDSMPAQLWPLWRLLYHATTGGFIMVMTLFALARGRLVPARHRPRAGRLLAARAPHLPSRRRRATSSWAAGGRPD